MESLSGLLSVEHVHLDDPRTDFDAYILTLATPISVPDNGTFQGVRRARRVQLESVPRNQRFLVGRCVLATGELTGPVTASDMGPLVMHVRSLQACKAGTS